MNTKSKGDISEAFVIAELLKKGYSVSIPFGDNQKYDLIFDDGNKLNKVQVKTGRYRKGVVMFMTSASVNTRMTNGTFDQKSYKGLVDYIAVYCLKLNKCYLIPIEDCPTKAMQLRIDKPKNNQIIDIKWGKDYEI